MENEQNWLAIPEATLNELICESVAKMNPTERRLWELVRIKPVKWQLPPWGDLGGGFWVVGIIGTGVLWYNDIEDGFNRSPYTTYGIIGAYLCNQDELDIAIYNLLLQLETGQRAGSFGPPEPIRKTD